MEQYYVLEHAVLVEVPQMQFEVIETEQAVKHEPVASMAALQNVVAVHSAKFVIPHPQLFPKSEHLFKQTPGVA